MGHERCPTRARVCASGAGREQLATYAQKRLRPRWSTFLRNHRDVISGMDLRVVPTARFKLLYVWFVIGRGRRRVLHVNVTADPSSAWVSQQLREADPDETSTRFLIRDHDSISSDRVLDWIEQLGIEPKATSYRSA